MTAPNLLARLDDSAASPGGGFGVFAGLGDLAGDDQMNEFALGRLNGGAVTIVSSCGMTPLQTIPDAEPGARFGASIVPMGDLNGDGYLDLAVGPRRNGGAGGVYLLRSNGSPGSDLSCAPPAPAAAAAAVVVAAVAVAAAAPAARSRGQGAGRSNRSRNGRSRCERAGPHPRPRKAFGFRGGQSLEEQAVVPGQTDSRDTTAEPGRQLADRRRGGDQEERKLRFATTSGGCPDILLQGSSEADQAVRGRFLQARQDQGLGMNSGSEKPLLVSNNARHTRGSLVRSDNHAAPWRRGRIFVTRMRVCLTLLISVAFLGAGPQSSFAVLDPTAGSAAGPAATTPAGSAAGTTGAQQSAATCPTPRLKGLPKTPQPANAVVPFKLTGLIAGAQYVLRVADFEVTGGVASGSVVKNKFTLFDPGGESRQGPDRGRGRYRCLQQRSVEASEEHRVQGSPGPGSAPAPATPAPGAPAAAVPSAPAKVAPVPPIKLPKVQKPVTQRLPDAGPPPSRRTWLTPLDSGARLDQKLSLPALSRLEQKKETANSSNALVGLGIVAAILTLAGGAGFLVFSRRDKVLFERAQTEQLKHLEEGDPGVGFSEDPDAPMAPAEAAPFAAAAVPIPTDPISTEPLPTEDEATEPLPTEPAPTEPPPTEPTPTQPLPVGAHPNGAPPGERHAQVEAELQRILTEAGLEAGLDGILVDARAEAERSGVALDQDLMLQALCDELNGSPTLSNTRRDELRSMFAAIIAEEAQRIPTDPISTEPLPTPGAPTEPAPAEPQPVGAQPNGAPQAERHAEVETEVHRILTEAGLEAGLEGILVHARAEAERSGIALDQDLILEALCDEISGSAKLSDTRREELRSVFAGIIAEEAQQAPADTEQVPAQ